MPRARSLYEKISRQDELDNLFRKFGNLGFDFKGRLHTNELEDLYRILNLDIGKYRKKKPTKANFLYAVELYFTE